VGAWPLWPLPGYTYGMLCLWLLSLCASHCALRASYALLCKHAGAHNIVDRGLLNTKGDPQDNNQKKNRKMVVNPDLDGYTEAQNHRNILRKIQKNNNLLKSKRMPKYELVGSCFFLHLDCQIALYPREVRLCVHYLEKSRTCTMFVIPKSIKTQIWKLRSFTEDRKKSETHRTSTWMIDRIR